MYFRNVRRNLTVHDVLNRLEEEGFFEADIYLTPPGDGQLSDEDSGDEEEGGEINNLNHRQLLAEGEGRILAADGNELRIGGTEDDDSDTNDGREEAGEEEEEQSDPEEGPSAAPSTSVREAGPRRPNQRRQQRPRRQWRKEDLQDGFPERWPNLQPPPFLQQSLDPVAFFELFFDDEVIDYLVEQTNLYASRDKGDHSFVTTRKEFQTFLAILLLSGYNQLPRRHLYWSRSSDCHNAAVSSAMSRNRFYSMMQNLHLADNSNLDPSDKLTKIRNFYSLLNEKCLLYFPAGRELAVDESMIPYFGHHSSKQFIKGKPIRFGFKLWTLADPLGYVVQFEPYAGARGNGTYGPLGLGGTVVKDLLSELPKRPYHVVFDNYFTSLPLLTDLAESGIGATGTLRKNRIEQCPMENAKLLAKKERGALDYRHDRENKLLVVEWNDNNVVTLATNCDPVLPLGQTKRWSKAHKRFVYINQPNIVKVYNATMGGVDRADQNIGTYRTSIRMKKWWFPFFVQAIEIAVQNAWLLYRRTDADHLDLLAFRRRLVKVYLMLNAAPTPTARPTLQGTLKVPGEVRFDGLGHFAGSSAKNRRCALCKKSTQKMCLKCDVGLHNQCFNEFHGVS